MCFSKILRMTSVKLDFLLGMERSLIRKQNTKMRRAITVRERLSWVFEHKHFGTLLFCLLNIYVCILCFLNVCLFLWRWNVQIPIQDWEHHCVQYCYGDMWSPASGHEGRINSILMFLLTAVLTDGSFISSAATWFPNVTSVSTGCLAPIFCTFSDIRLKQTSFWSCPAPIASLCCVSSKAYFQSPSCWRWMDSPRGQEKGYHVVIEA